MCKCVYNVSCASMYKICYSLLFFFVLSQSVRLLKSTRHLKKKKSDTSHILFYAGRFLSSEYKENLKNSLNSATNTDNADL